MMWPPFTRRAALFAARLDGRQVAGSLDDDTAALVAFAQRLRLVERPALRADYAASLRVRLLDAAPELLTARAAVADPGKPRAGAYRSRGNRQLRLGVATATAIVLATAVGIGYASQSALPGDPLYPFKQTIENVEVATAGSLTDQGNAQLSQASTRLSEVQDLASRPSQGPSTTILMQNAMGDFSHEANDGTVTLLKAYHVDNAPQAIVDLREFTGKSVASLNQLTTLRSSVPPSVLHDVGNAASLMRWVDAAAKQTCASCTKAPALVLPAALNAIAPVVPPSTPNGLLPGNATPPVVPLPGSSSSAPPASVDPSDVVSVAPPTLPPVTVPPPTIAAPTTGDPPSTVPDPTTAPVTPPPVTDPVTTDPPTSSLPAGPTPTLPTTADPPSDTTSSDPGESANPPPSTESTPPSDPTIPSGLTSAPPSDLGPTL
jgi:hypothetical protein